MFPPRSITQAVLKAVEASPGGVSSLDILESLRLCSRATLKTTLSRLKKSGRVLILKRGIYSANPMKDIYFCAQNTFNGYLGFSTALHLHKLIAEMPFTITVVTTFNSKTKSIGEYEFRAVALKEKAVGFQKTGNYVLSTRPKTLFDCLYLPKYAVEREKLIELFRRANLTKEEWKEFDNYAGKFAKGKKLKQIVLVKKAIRGD